MSWKKHFRTVTTNPLDAALHAQQGNMPEGKGSTSKFSSILPEIYAGHPNRIQRYYQYEDMARDSDIASALDTIADFCTQSEEQSDMPFLIHYNETGSDSEIKILKQTLTQWVKANNFKSKLHRIFRNACQNGDVFFLRDPEDHTWIACDHYAVELVKMSTDGKEKPEEYVIKNFKPYVTEKIGTMVDDISKYRNPGQNSPMTNRPMTSTGSTQFQMAGSDRDPRSYRGGNSNPTSAYVAIKAESMIHISLNDGDMDINFPFGQSILDPVFKTFKQKELLEDSIIIYRVQRAPERRVFYIDVGGMNGVRAQGYIEGIKNEIHQRRIPNRTGGGSQIMDTAYNPLCLALDTRIPLLDGRTLTIAELGEEYRSGKENWVYSCDPITGNIVPGNITWAGTTRRNAEVIKITFDNGETLTCTPDHKIPVWGKGFVEAKDILPEDSLISFVTGNEQVFDHKTGRWVFVKEMVGEFFHNKEKHQQLTFLPKNTGKIKDSIQHKDFNPSNNDPRNLTFMNSEDRAAFNMFNGKSISNIVPETINVSARKVTKHEGFSNQDTGTITVDGQERWHNHHTFAIEAGVFVKNSMLDDYFFAQTPEGRGSKVEVLPSGDALGEITDLSYFTKKMARGLRIPTSYLSLGNDEQQGTYNDGKVGAAMIQEFLFNKYCMRLQALLAPTFDKSFKEYLAAKGAFVEESLFELKFNPPQNFSKYRQIELDVQQTQVYGAVAGNTKMSERFKFKRFLNLTPDELLENEEMWMEENPDKMNTATGSTSADGGSDGADLGAVGFRPGGDDLNFDLPEGGADGQEPGAGPDAGAAAPGGPAPDVPAGGDTGAPAPTGG